MRIHHAWANHAVTFAVECDDDERPATYQTSRHYATLAPHPVTGDVTFRFLLPDVLTNFDAVHPDLWGLVVFLVVAPFVGAELRLSFAVSSDFALAVADSTGKRVVPVDPTLEPRPGGTVAPDGTPRGTSVAYSGRVHSYVTAALMGQRARLVALDHWNATAGVRTAPYPADGLYFALDAMEVKQYRVAMVKTDVASVCAPYGLAHPLTATVGNVLLADALQLHTVAMGSRLHDLRAFDTGPDLAAVGFKHVDVPVADDPSVQGGTLVGWRRLFGVCGLALELPTCGIHDALIVRLLHEHRLWSEAHYCLYARPAFRCQACVECLYYDELRKAAKGNPTPFDALWSVCQEKYPETLACVQESSVAHRWHGFWAAVVGPDTGPDAPFVHALHTVWKRRATALHPGVQRLSGRTAWGVVEGGLRRLVSVLGG